MYYYKIGLLCRRAVETKRKKNLKNRCGGAITKGERYMKRYLKRVWLMVLAAFASLFIIGGLGACSFGVTKDDIMQENGLEVCVSYHANGGLFENNTNKKDIYYPAGNPAAPIGFVEITNAKIKKDGYELEGWYHVKKDENGEPIYEDKEAELFALGEKVDFSQLLENGKDWEICANWLVLTKVKVRLVVFDENEQIDRAVKVKDVSGKEYQTGAEVSSFSYQDGVVNTATLAPFEVQNKSHTFVQYYSDEACSQNIEWPIVRDEENDIYIYAKYITGNWKVLKTSNDVWNMFVGSSFTGVGYYLLNDITYTDGALESLSKKGFDYKFYGNAHKIIGLQVKQQVSVNNFSGVSLFGALGQNAVIKDLTFENLSVEFTVNGTGAMQANYLFTALHEQAKIENLAVSGVFKLTVKASVELPADFETAWQ